jgi:hypothetical protein
MKEGRGRQSASSGSNKPAPILRVLLLPMCVGLLLLVVQIAEGMYSFPCTVPVLTAVDFL